MRDGNDTPCDARPVPGSMFCAEHANCRASPLSGAEPRYDPRPFADPAVRATHNCFTYAVMGGRVDARQVAACRDEATRRSGKPGDCPDVRFQQPGAASGHAGEMAHANRRQCASVVPLLLEDVPGAYRTTFAGRCAPGTSKIALAVDPATDYHLYLQNADGLWSDKPGARAPRRTDGAYQPLFNPAAAVRDFRASGDDLNYTDFCSFLCVPRGDKAPHLAQGGGSRRRRHGGRPQSRRHAHSRRNSHRRHGRRHSHRHSRSDRRAVVSS